MTHTPFPAATIVRLPPRGPFPRAEESTGSVLEGKITQDELRQAAADVQRTYYDRVIERGLSATNSSIPATFSYYDQVLDAVRLFTLVPKRLCRRQGCARSARSARDTLL